MRARFFVRRDVVGVLGGRAALDISIKKKKKPASCGSGIRGAPDRIRTYGFLLRRQTLYPLSYWGTSQSPIIR